MGGGREVKGKGGDGWRERGGREGGEMGGGREVKGKGGRWVEGERWKGKEERWMEGERYKGRERERRKERGI